MTRFYVKKILRQIDSTCMRCGQSHFRVGDAATVLLLARDAWSRLSISGKLPPALLKKIDRKRS